MNHFAACVLLAIAAAAAFVVPAGAARQPAQQAVPSGVGVETKPYVQWAGPHSLRKEPGFIVIRDDDAWRTLWAEHAGVKADAPWVMTRHAAPKIDFDRCMVIAYFRGPTTNTDGDVAESVRETDDRVLIRFQASTFQTAGDDGRGGAQDVTPFGIWVIDATDKPIVIEEGSRSMKNQPVRWREVKRLPATPAR